MLQYALGCLQLHKFRSPHRTMVMYHFGDGSCAHGSPVRNPLHLLDQPAEILRPKLARPREPNTP